MFRMPALVLSQGQRLAMAAPLALRTITVWTAGSPATPALRVCLDGLLVRSMSKVAKKKKGSGGGGASRPESQSRVDAIIENIELDEEETEQLVQKDTPLRQLLDTKHQGGGPPKKGGSAPHRLQYAEFNKLVDGERVWKELEQQLTDLKDFYIHQLTVRSSTSLDELPIQFEGDSYPLNELASISKKDPKRIIIDVSAFPQASPNIMTAIRESGLNLNPQQDGLRITVPIPKVTKEHREHLAEGARKRLTQTKLDLRKIQNKFQKLVGEKELAGQVTKDDARAASETIKYIQDHFAALGDAALNTKLKELSGK